MIREQNLLEGSIAATLFKLALPNLFAVLCLLLYHLTDAYFIGRLGTTPLAALSLTFPVTLVIGSIALGLGTGIATETGHFLGKGDRQQGRQFITHGLLLAVILVAFIGIGGALTINPLFRLLGADAQLLALLHDYMLIWYLGIGLLVLPIVGNQALRATGNTYTPAIVTAIAALLNAILDPLLIFGIGPFPRLEIQGAAIASILSWAVAFLVALYMLIWRHKLLAFICWKRIRQHWRMLLNIARPAALCNLLNPIANAILIAMLARLDTSAVAAFGAGTRIESLLLIIVTALSGALAPFIAQNLGAGQRERANKALFGSFHLILFCQWVLCLIVWPLANDIAQIFGTEPEMNEHLTLYLTWVPLAYGSLGIVILLANCLNVYHQPMSALVLNLLRVIGILVPIAWLGSYLFGVKGIILAIPLTNLIAGVGAYVLAKRLIKPDFPVLTTQ